MNYVYHGESEEGRHKCLLFTVFFSFSTIDEIEYGNDPKFSNNLSGQTLQSQISCLIKVFTVCYSICIFLKKYAMVWPLCLNFRRITAKFSGIQKLRNFTVM